MQESTRNTTKKRLLFTFVVALLFLPMIQKQLGVVDVKPLNGSFTTLEAPQFSINDWFDGTYSTDELSYLDQNIGFRNIFVRVYNQLHYTLFNQAKANSVVIGKDNYLYEENYIRAYLGSDFIGNDQIAEKVTKLEKINDTLRTIGIDLIVVLAPGKGSFYPEFIPDSYDPQNRSTTNYEVYSEHLSRSNIQLLDFHKLFKELKNSSPHPLFPKTGIHWSKYGEVLVADSIINYITSTQGYVNMPQLVLTDLEYSTTMRGTDDDIEKGMNLLADIQDLEMGYPKFKIQTDSSSISPKVLTIADSYYWGMFNWGLSRDAFDGGQCWFYNEQIYPDSYSNPVNVKDIDIKASVQENDLIILMSTDANLYRFAFGFIDQLYEVYYE
jgi:hypothetical protein